MSMTKEDLALALHGISYPCRIDAHLIEQAKAAGLVIVYGASDDLMEFRGAVRDELGCYGGGTGFVDAKGVLPNREDIDDDEDLADYFARKPLAKQIEALWAKEDGYSWTYATDIPHATFEIVEDGESYCRGLVFALADLAGAEPR